MPRSSGGAIGWRPEVRSSRCHVPCAPTALRGPRLRATRGGRHSADGTPCGPVAFVLGASFSANGAFRPAIVLARRSGWTATPAARRRAPRGAPHRVRRAERCGLKHEGASASPQRTAPERAAGCLAQRASGGGRAIGGSPAGRAGTAARRDSESGAVASRQLRARRNERWLNDAHRDARGVEVPAARWGAGTPVGSLKN